MAFIFPTICKVSVLKNCTMNDHHVVSGAHGQDKPKMPKRYAKPIVFRDTTPKEHKHQIRSQIEMIRHDFIDCTALHRLLIYVLRLEEEQYHGVSAATHDGGEYTFSTLWA